MRARLPFTKMHGLGNDFVVVDARGTARDDWPTIARAMCDRHFGAGADQLILVTESLNADLGMRLFNTDGFEAEMCGNGVRCVGKYAFERGLIGEPTFRLETLGGIKQIELAVREGRVTGATVAMGTPCLAPLQEITVAKGANNEPLRLTLTPVDMGNPHAVAFLESPVEEFGLERVGPLVERHRLFPNRTNFEVVNVLSPERLRVRVWERSAGITLACGTGACAAVAAGRRRGLTTHRVQVELPGGTLEIRWDGEGEIFMSGPASTVFEGVWDPD